MTGDGIRVSAIVVSYNVAALLSRCLSSLRAAQAAGELHEIIVIDSFSADNSVEVVRRQFPDVILEVVPNRGYGASVNAGLERATGTAMLILNPDTEVCLGAVATLKRALFASPVTGLVGPRLRYPDGSDQPTRRRFPTPWTPFFESTILEEWFPGNRWARAYRMLDLGGCPATGPSYVDWLVGAALMVKRDVVDTAGGFDEAFFLYGEELEWCSRIGRHGWKVCFVPDATIVHHEAASTSQAQLASRLEFDRGRVRAQRALHGALVAHRTARLLRLNFVLQLAREGLKWLVGHRRELRAQRLRQYWTLLRADLND